MAANAEDDGAGAGRDERLPPGRMVVIFPGRGPVNHHRAAVSPRASRPAPIRCRRF